VASLLTSEPNSTGMELGRKIMGSLRIYSNVNREEVIGAGYEEMWAKIAPSIFYSRFYSAIRGVFVPHVVSALKGILKSDEQTKLKEHLL